MKRSQDVQLTQKDIYIGTNVFKTIFQTVFRSERSLRLIIQRTTKENISQLSNSGLYALAQGEDVVIEKLKVVVEDLVLDKDIEERIQSYHVLYKQLSNTENYTHLKEKIQDLSDYVHGGQLLGGVSSCEVCKPPKI